MRDCSTTGGRWSSDESCLHINELELQAVYFALKSLYTDVSSSHIRIMSDNTTTVCYINNMGGSKSRSCNDIARKILHFALEKKMCSSPARIVQ